MEHLLDTVDTIGDGLGFAFYSTFHLCWLAVFVLFVVLSCIYYRRSDGQKRAKWRKTIAILLIADELFKMAVLFIGGNYDISYLPLHLCSINIFLIAAHAIRPSQTLGSYLYTVGVPGALSALLFPNWASLPPVNLMVLHSFTVHILLAAYPLVLTIGGDIKPKIKDIPRCLVLLFCLAAFAYGFNTVFDTNFMFLMYAPEGNPLRVFETMWGNHLYGYPIIIAAVLVVMYLPIIIQAAVRRHGQKKLQHI